ncbi:MAG: hypothetical protein WC657_06975 [Candidatus Paceibacterota bacterium]|jgi:hypothetical protein
MTTVDQGIIAEALYTARQALFRPDHPAAEGRKAEALENIQQAENMLPALESAIRERTLYRNVLEETRGTLQVASSMGDPVMVDQKWLDLRIARITRALGDYAR